MKHGDVTFIGRPVGVVADWTGDPAHAPVPSSFEEDFRYEPEVNVDALRAREEAELIDEIPTCMPVWDGNN